MKSLIVVGTGDHFKRILYPSLILLHNEGVLGNIQTIDIRERGESAEGSYVIPHIIRKGDEPISHLVQEHSNGDSIVFLAHAHTHHTKDALEIVESGFSVVVEKPYCIDNSELIHLSYLINKHPQKVALAEYYLMMKSVPLLHASGLLKPDTFYLHKFPQLQFESPTNNDPQQDTFALSRIGNILFILCDILEGEGKTGRLDHRDQIYAQRSKGGGAIFDLGIHAIAPLIALSSQLGTILSSSIISVTSAIAQEYLEYAKDNLGIPKADIAETYARIKANTDLGIPIFISIGKYVLPNENLRRLILVGDMGYAHLDLSTCTLYISCKDLIPVQISRLQKMPESKYIPVLRAVFAILDQDSPFLFNATNVAMAAQEFVLQWRKLSYSHSPILPIYSSGATPSEISQVIILVEEAKMSISDNTAYSGAWNEAVRRVIARDSILIAYVAASGTLIAASFRDEGSASLALAIPFITLIAGFLIGHHDLMISKLNHYMKPFVREGNSGQTWHQAQLKGSTFIGLIFHSLPILVAFGFLTLISINRIEDGEVILRGIPSNIALPLSISGIVAVFIGRLVQLWEGWRGGA